MDDSRIWDDRATEELAEVQRMEEVIWNAMRNEVRKLAQLMVSKRSDQLFGETEFTIRDIVLRAGARAIEATVNDRKKGGIKVPASSANAAAKTRNSTVGASEPSQP